MSNNIFMKCPNCQETDHASNAVFCHMCGHKLQKNKLNDFIHHNDRWILGGLGLFLIILALCGFGTILNAIGGGCMIGAATLLPELKK